MNNPDIMHALKTFLQFDTNNIHLQGVGGTMWVYIPLSPVSLASSDTCKRCEKDFNKTQRK